MGRRSGKLQVIVIKDELGNYLSFKLSKRFLFSSVLLLLAALCGLAAYSVYAFKELSRLQESRQALSSKVKNLESKLAIVQAQRERLKERVAQLEKERVKTVEALAERVKQIDALMKEVGVDYPKSSGEGGVSLPLDSLLTSGVVPFKDLVGGVDALIKDLKDTPLGYPTEGRITSKFGLRRNPVTGALEFHLGVDIANRWGTPVRATADGVVVRAGWCGLMGRCVEIKHGSGIYTYYGHLSKITVFKGEHVSRGMIIGIMGSSGRSTGPHLHYSVRIDGKLVNPLPFMEAGLAGKGKKG
ncbi:Peptidase M23 [Thermovibrio ammonificans HB-1]|uniref:Peptidase M23 n=1 Tax=Thermovibrio ammonificans (strain DSM 15698 / JCM 12110 / HB-1) TaxID=648996 RepID=E8T6L2_THEA1|nr:M23 family metallopeptidase [Thermovibrio ammonificans]ADU96796.1 Peptidase M23 [Thermovibrio ammonificans HB-1]